jgi:hypothetical protein
VAERPVALPPEETERPKKTGMHTRLSCKIDLYEEPDVKGANEEPVVTRVLTIMLAEED